MVLDPETFYNNSLSTIATTAIAKGQLHCKKCALFEISQNVSERVNILQ